MFLSPLAGYAPGRVEGFTGALLVYSPQYDYETGLAYEAGSLQPLRMALTMSLPADAPPDTCYDFFLIGFDNTGAEIVHDFIGTKCTGGISGIGGHWGGGGGGTSGGGGGGGPVTPMQPRTPCAALTRDGQNTQTLAQMNQLKAQLNDNKEHGVAITYDAAGNPTFTTGTGPAGGLDMGNWSAPAGASSIIHTHYSGVVQLERTAS